MGRRRSSGAFGTRGIMVDPARQGERHEFYFELLELMAEIITEVAELFPSPYFRVVVCPALCHSGDMIAPNGANYVNMDDMTATLAGRSQR